MRRALGANEHGARHQIPVNRYSTYPPFPHRRGTPLGGENRSNRACSVIHCRGKKIPKFGGVWISVLDSHCELSTLRPPRCVPGSAVAFIDRYHARGTSDRRFRDNYKRLSNHHIPSRVFASLFHGCKALPCRRLKGCFLRTCGPLRSPNDEEKGEG